MNSALVHALLTLLLVGAAPDISAQIAPRVFDAADYGAIPDDGKDDTEALRRLFETAATQKDVTVRLNPGRYIVTAPQENPDNRPIFLIKEARGFRLEGKGAKIAVSGNAGLFEFRESTEVNIEQLSVDWSEQPHMGVRVRQIADGSAILEQESAGTAMWFLPLKACYIFDLKNHRPAAGREERYWMGVNSGPVLVPLGYKTFRLPMENNGERVDLLKGDRVVLRFAVYGANAFSFYQCDRVGLKKITIHSAPGMGIRGEASSNLELSEINICPAEGQWMSTTADAAHFANCRGKVVIRDCLFDGMGDDAMNIHSDLLLVGAIFSRQQVSLQMGRDPHRFTASVPRPGDRLAVAAREHPLLFHDIGQIRSAQIDTGSATVRVELDSELEANFATGSVAVNLTGTASLTAERVTVRNNRARGFLIQTPQAVRISNCRFEEPSGSAIQLTSDIQHWWEGPPVRDVRIEHCVFVGGNKGLVRHGGVISVYADDGHNSARDRVHQGIVISDNLFKDYGGHAIFLSSSSSEVSNNRFLGRDQPVIWGDSDSTTLANNLFIHSPR